MSALVRGIAMVGVLLVPAVASANGLRLRSQQTTHYSYPSTSYYFYPAYYPSHSVVECLPVAPSVMPRATTTAEPPQAGAPRKLAQPVPAPASPEKGSETPRGAGVSESRSYFSAYAVVVRDAQPRPANDRARVGFWNLSNADITLTVANQAYALQRGKSLTLDLPREFVWRVDSREPQNEKMPENESALEIVIRR
jgi:hypothetical protein